jgi:exopolyphosphatase/guanosine-5'-triphosphate,3'-diphosphate pyrophosphatase
MTCAFLSGIFLTICCTLSAAAIDKTYAIRAAIDIGTGGPKLRVAEIDLATNKITKLLHTQNYFVNFYDKKNSGQLSDASMEQGLQAFQEAVDQALSLNAEGIVAVATASFRSAANGETFAQKIQQETGVQVHIIDQELEGKLTFQAVLSHMNSKATKLIVWDIGGGSMQWISATSDGTYISAGLKEGVGDFKDFIIEHIQHRNPQKTKSPNPMTAEEIEQAIDHAQDLSCKIDLQLQNKIASPTTTIVGAGSVFGRGIQEIIGDKNTFSFEDLAKAVFLLANHTDADLGGGDFAFVKLSNALFVLGFMQHLKIEQMEILDVNNADGAMLYSPFWEGKVR